MGTNFPTSLDSTFNPSVQIGQTGFNVADAIAALEAKVGVNSSAVTSSLDYIINQLLFPTGSGAFPTYTPTLVQSGAVTKTMSPAAYIKIGRLVVGYIRLLVTGTGTGSTEVRAGIPVAAAAGSTQPCGIGYIYDSSAGLHYKGMLSLDNANYFTYMGTGDTGVGRLGASVFTAALASSDQVAALFAYESAS